MPREVLTKMVEVAFDAINNDQVRNNSIMKAFDMCGLNPYAEDTKAFDDHLDSLDRNKLYNLLNTQHTWLDKS